MEIERKFKISKLPANLEQYKKKEIIQGYLCTQPVVRIRKSNENYILTYKNKSNFNQEHAVISEEIELPLTKEAFEHLLSKVDFGVIEKTRYLIPLSQDHTAELDVFHGRLSGLMFVEVEFSSEKDAIDFIKPDWFEEDVSKDKRYRNSYLISVSSLEELHLDSEE
ncbi:CYTH domain-containing protein [Lachnoclostridium phytofermentans]|uniref:Adenylate cyclase n=1 Tax=Lachnoclostridium phytofermentans (strain ATCC 700394 / DSM 18823 / ISDg) TaxID=357809 RepID=A9KKP1_LACP7|nr:CYTH domain-containing protein [Lachnoclostridium phytofermentans]ABX41212.1 adenylate cyclase [Lachnoclostridium phytofermentans ISDg]